jgi:histidine triad (HIT) family protein
MKEGMPMQDPNCIFCKIIAGQIPCAPLIDDDFALAFLDIGPLAEGHALLIPKDHYVTLDQVPADVAAGLLRHLPALGKAVQEATGASGFNVLQNNGKVAHQEVPHVHFHIIPRKPGDAFHFNWPAGKYPLGRLDELVARVKALLSK